MYFQDSCISACCSQQKIKLEKSHLTSSSSVPEIFFCSHRRMKCNPQTHRNCNTPPLPLLTRGEKEERCRQWKRYVSFNKYWHFQHSTLSPCLHHWSFIHIVGYIIQVINFTFLLLHFLLNRRNDPNPVGVKRNPMRVFSGFRARILNEYRFPLCHLPYMIYDTL